MEFYTTQIIFKKKIHVHIKFYNKFAKIKYLLQYHNIIIKFSRKIFI